MTTAFALDRKASKASSSKAQLAFYLVVSTLLAGAAAYFESFSQMAPYDDEGYMMANVVRFLNGHALYDQVGIFHGPVYFIYERAFHHLTGTTLSHDSVRIVSAAFWLITTVICFLVVYKLTRSVLMAGIAQLLVFGELSFLSDEPAHPQEACILLLTLVGLQACYARNRVLAAVSLGALAGTITLTKINLGACVLLALSIVVFSILKEGFWQRLGFVAASVAAIIFPILLMRPHLSERWAAAFCVVAVLSICTVVLVAARPSVAERFRWQHLLLAIAAFLTSILIISSLVFARGTTPAAMLKWLIVWPATRFQTWFLPPPISLWAIPWAMVSLFTAWQFWVKKKNHKAITLLKTGFALAVALLCLGHYWILGFAAPFLWLVAVPPNDSSHDTRGFGRTVLAVVGVLQVLYVYPVAGSQLQFATVFVILAALVCLWDVREPL